MLTNAQFTGGTEKQTRKRPTRWRCGGATGPAQRGVAARGASQERAQAGGRGAARAASAADASQLPERTAARPAAFELRAAADVWRQPTRVAPKLHHQRAPGRGRAHPSYFQDS